MNLRKSRLLVFFVPLMFSLPYINRALFVDDQFFVRIATWLKDNPTRPYDFAMEDAAGQTLTQDEILASIVNPLLHTYVLAGLMKLGGEAEWFLRGVCILFTCFSGLFLFELARRWLKEPLWATLLVLLTPVTAVSAHSLLIDPTMNFFFLAALLSLVLALETEKRLWSVLSGAAFGLALLSKYTAVLFAPIAVALWFFQGYSRRRFSLMALALGIGFLMLGGYLEVTRIMYGKTHLAASVPLGLQNVSWSKIFVLFLFIGGGMLVPILSWFVHSPRTRIYFVGFGGLLALFFVSPWGGFRAGAAVLMAFFFTSFLGLLWTTGLEWKYFKTSHDRFLCAWTVLFLLMMAVVMPWVAVRYLLIGVPAVVFLAVRLLELKYPASAQKIIQGTVVVLFASSTALAVADFKQAETSRRILVDAGARGWDKPEPPYFFGSAFTMTYLKKAGWPVCPPFDQLRPGDRIVVSEITMPLSWFFRRRLPLRPVDTIEYQSNWPVKVMDSKSGAAFYGSAWGPLPYSFSMGPSERFHLFEVTPLVGNY